MEIRNDFKELLDWFCVSTVRRPFRKSPQGNKRKVAYLIVGGYALAFHGTTSIYGVSWEKADTGEVPGRYGQTPVCFISREDIVTNKRTTGGRRDAADIEAGLLPNDPTLIGKTVEDICFNNAKSYFPMQLD